MNWVWSEVTDNGDAAINDVPFPLGTTGKDFQVAAPVPGNYKVTVTLALPGEPSVSVSNVVTVLAAPDLSATTMSVTFLDLESGLATDTPISGECRVQVIINHLEDARGNPVSLELLSMNQEADEPVASTPATVTRSSGCLFQPHAWW
eukprot:gnl/Dysnectes_brevis/1986_a2286_2497.p3 GENE.gnl/Dysnectes_brevis/1986_a2286_2497~~gnl/Dysnectes_brevis/1986_a2286_2497.p3  ORF type:complete len:148 (+),score=41.01 gnl/Dysnectes_brevis/1986_a2286_2497:1193-1636(+)